MGHKEVRMTLAERENLMADYIPHFSGFTPRVHQRSISHHRPHTMTDIECRHFLRSSTQEFTSQRPILEHRLWIEAGKMMAPFPAEQNKSYNSNIWRNFHHQFGANFSTEGRRITEAIAALYPVNIPAPSKIGDNTFDKYLRETNFFENDKAKNLAIRRAATDISELKRLKCRSEARNPPINKKGDILPPENFKKYARWFVPVPSPPPTPPPPGQKTDVFGRQYTPHSKPVLYKLSYKLNHPNFQKLQEEIMAQRKMTEKLYQKSFSNTNPQIFHSPSFNETTSEL